MHYIYILCCIKVANNQFKMQVCDAGCTQNSITATVLATVAITVVVFTSLRNMYAKF